jgi:hypothetical protein
MFDCSRPGIANSKVMLVCLNRNYQSRENCMYELKQASSLCRPIVTLVMEDNPLKWASREVQDLCQLNNRLYVNFNRMGKMNWNDESGPTADMLAQYGCFSLSAIPYGHPLASCQRHEQRKWSCEYSSAILAWTH